MGKYLIGDFMEEKFFQKKIDEITVSNSKQEKTIKKISESLDLNKSYLKEQLGDSFDVKYRSAKVGEVSFLFVMLDGMCDNLLITEQIMMPILESDFSDVKENNISFKASDGVSGSIDKSVTADLDEAIDELLTGNLLMLVENSTVAVLFSVQKFAKRSPSEPNTESQERGSREGFVELFKDNVAMVRRRVRNPVFKIKTLDIGTTSKTKVCVCYMSDRVNPKTLDSVINRLKSAELDVVEGAGYIQPFLDHKTPSLFSCVGRTERPDVFVSKMSEGKVGIIIDGTPDALIVPHLFTENFHSLDDYLKRPYFAFFARIIKIISFLISVFLPGIYVAICTFHQEMIPETMIFGITSQESKTPLPVVAEALLIHLIYEIVREAGLRIPKAVGHAVSIVGALVIGESAVSAGLIAAPMLIVVGLTAICSFVISSLYEPVAILRFAFILIGGIGGIYGICFGFAVVLVNISALCPYGVPFMSPLSPTKPGAWRDLVRRESWIKLGKRRMQIDKLEK